MAPAAGHPKDNRVSSEREPLTQGPTKAVPRERGTRTEKRQGIKAGKPDHQTKIVGRNTTTQNSGLGSENRQNRSCELELWLKQRARQPGRRRPGISDQYNG